GHGFTSTVWRRTARLVCGGAVWDGARFPMGLRRCVPHPWWLPSSVMDESQSRRRPADPWDDPRPITPAMPPFVTPPGAPVSPVPPPGGATLPPGGTTPPPGATTPPPSGTTRPPSGTTRRPGSATPPADGHTQPPAPPPMYGRAKVPTTPRVPDPEEADALVVERPVVVVRPSKPISWQRASRASLRSLTDGWGLSFTGFLIAFSG